jgi:hypothetical protein
MNAGFLIAMRARQRDAKRASHQLLPWMSRGKVVVDVLAGK